jgi:hypothetical protein
MEFTKSKNLVEFLLRMPISITQRAATMLEWSYADLLSTVVKYSLPWIDVKTLILTR